jgi:hypothetical protein
MTTTWCVTRWIQQVAAMGAIALYH